MAFRSGARYATRACPVRADVVRYNFSPDRSPELEVSVSGYTLQSLNRAHVLRTRQRAPSAHLATQHNRETPAREALLLSPSPTLRASIPALTPLPPAHITYRHRASAARNTNAYHHHHQSESSNPHLSARFEIHAAAANLHHPPHHLFTHVLNAIAKRLRTPPPAKHLVRINPNNSFACASLIHHYTKQLQPLHFTLSQTIHHHC